MHHANNVLGGQHITPRGPSLVLRDKTHHARLAHPGVLSALPRTLIVLLLICIHSFGLEQVSYAWDMQFYSSVGMRLALFRALSPQLSSCEEWD